MTKKRTLPETGGQFKLASGKLTQTQKPTEPRKPGPKEALKEAVKGGSDEQETET